MSNNGSWLTEDDFERLSVSGMQWAGNDWEEQDGRFSTARRGEFVRYDLAYAFWFDTVAACLMGREFLRAKGAQFQELIDKADTHCVGCNQSIKYEPYVLITDYETDSWKAIREGRPCPHHH
jgi:hypothetical protein